MEGDVGGEQLELDNLTERTGCRKNAGRGWARWWERWEKRLEGIWTMGAKRCDEKGQKRAQMKTRCGKEQSEARGAGGGS